MDPRPGPRMLRVKLDDGKTHTTSITLLQLDKFSQERACRRMPLRLLVWTRTIPPPRGSRAPVRCPQCSTAARPLPRRLPERQCCPVGAPGTTLCGLCFGQRLGSSPTFESPDSPRRKPPLRAKTCPFAGTSPSGANRDRTGDLLLAKQALSQLELWPRALDIPRYKADFGHAGSSDTKSVIARIAPRQLLTTLSAGSPPQAPRGSACRSGLRARAHGGWRSRRARRYHSGCGRQRAGIPIGQSGEGPQRARHERCSGEAEHTQRRRERRV